MRNEFIKTSNVKRFISLMDSLQKAPPSVPKMALVYGAFGLGKSQAIMWWVTNNDAIYIRCNHRMTSRWLLTEIVKELDEVPSYLTSNLFHQIEEKLKYNPKVIIVDEIDYLFTYSNTIETLRDIHDKLGVPIVFVGMELAGMKMKKYGHINDRLFAKMKFQKLVKEDFKTIIESLSEVKFDEETIKYVTDRNLQFRQLVKLISKAENLAITNKLEEINIDLLRVLMNEE